MSIFATGFSGVMGKMNETTLEVQQENTNYSLENTIPDSDSPSFSSQSINIKSTKMTIPKGSDFVADLEKAHSLNSTYADVLVEEFKNTNEALVDKQYAENELTYSQAELNRKLTPLVIFALILGFLGLVVILLAVIYLAKSGEGECAKSIVKAVGWFAGVVSSLAVLVKAFKPTHPNASIKS